MQLDKLYLEMDSEAVRWKLMERDAGGTSIDRHLATFLDHDGETSPLARRLLSALAADELVTDTGGLQREAVTMYQELCFLIQKLDRRKALERIFRPLLLLDLGRRRVVQEHARLIASLGRQLDMRLLASYEVRAEQTTEGDDHSWWQLSPNDDDVRLGVKGIIPGRPDYPVGTLVKVFEPREQTQEDHDEQRD